MKKAFTVCFCMFIILNGHAQWKLQSNGIADAGRYTCLATKEDQILAGKTGHGIYYSNNNGYSWQSIDDWIMVDNYSVLFFDGYIYAGMFDGLYYTGSYGNTWWHKYYGGMPGAEIDALGSCGGVLFVGNEYGVYKSTDDGTTFRWCNACPSGYSVYAFATKGDEIYAGGLYGAFKSTDFGDTWTQISTGLPSSGYGTVVISLAFNSTNIFAGTNGAGVYTSINDGANWTPVNNGITTENVNAIFVNGSTIFIGTDNGVFLSNNNGSNWTAVNTGLINFQILSLAVSGTTIFAGSNNGLWARPLSELTTAAPEVVTIIATNVQANNAVLNGTVNPSNLETTVEFEYGTTSGYGHTLAVDGSPFNVYITMSVNQLINGLNPNTTYHFRIKATNLLGTTFGTDQQFTTNSSAVSSIKNLIKFQISPNPSYDIITVEIENPAISQSLNCAIYDLQGQLMLQQPISSSKTEISITGLSRGVFLIKIESQEGMSMKTFIKE